MTKIKNFIKAALFLEFFGAFFLAMKYFFAKKATINYPHEKRPAVPAFSRRTCFASLR